MNNLTTIRKTRNNMTSQESTGECPDCGNQNARVNVIRAKEIPSAYWLVIDCLSCRYYEFSYHGPDI